MQVPLSNLHEDWKIALWWMQLPKGVICGHREDVPG